MRVLILGKGRMGRAIDYYLKKQNLKEVSFFNAEKDVENTELVISALPGDAGELALKLALKFKKDLIDIADLDHSSYLKNEDRIKKTGITVVPFAGFSPGLVNFICGREAEENMVEEIIISAGSLSRQKNSFPFLWCFEDLIEGHQLKATLVENGKIIKKPAFSDYRKLKIENLDAESYLAEGLCSLIDTLKVKNMSYRIIRNLGFCEFFKSLEEKGLLDEEAVESTKKQLESAKHDNLTIGIIKIRTGKKEITWKMKSASKKNESLNSMQKITAVFPVFLAKEILSGNINQRGLLFPEYFGQDKELFKKLTSQIKTQIHLEKS